MSRLIFHDSLVAVMRASAVPGVTWADPGEDDPVGSPYYEEVPEPAPPFPYVAYELPDSSIEHSFEQDSYVETWRPTIYVVGLREHVVPLSSPHEDGSLIKFLDGLMETPEELDGDNFECLKFIRVGYRLYRDRSRGPTGARVWFAAVPYEAMTQPKES